MLKVLIEEGKGDPLREDIACGGNSLHFVCRNGNASLEIIKYLVEKGASPQSANADNQSSLHLALLNEKVDICIINFLLERVEANQLDKFGKTPLFYLASNKFACSDLFQNMIERGADPLVEDFQARNVTHVVSMNEGVVGGNCVRILKLFMIYGTDIFKKDDCGFAPKHYCERLAKKDVVEFLCGVEGRIVWNIEDHKLFPPPFREKVRTLIACNRRLVHPLKIPRPVLHIIIQIYSLDLHEEDFPHFCGANEFKERKRFESQQNSSKQKNGTQFLHY